MKIAAIFIVAIAAIVISAMFHAMVKFICAPTNIIATAVTLNAVAMLPFLVRYLMFACA